jgi:hypothetical protein
MTMQLGRLPSPSAGRGPGGGDTILRRVRRYLQVHQRATLGDLALHFDVAPEAMRGMLETWLRKGRVRELAYEATCNTSCPTACDDTAMTIFEWVEPTGPSGFTSLPLLAGDDAGCCRHRG